MENIFEDFQIWIKSKYDVWKKQDVIIREIVEPTHAHEIHVNLDSEVGYGHIGLYESNDIYWIEFEAVARDFETFYKYIEFNKLPYFYDLEIEYIEFLTRV